MATRKKKARQRRPSSTGTTYDEGLIGDRIEARRVELKMETKHVYEPMGWDKGEYSRKTHGETPIHMAEYAKLKDLLQGWTGFPFVDKTQGVVLDALPDRLDELVQYLAQHPAQKKSEK